MVLSLRDPETGVVALYFLATYTYFNGTLLRCTSEVTQPAELCTAFPGYVHRGKTHFAVLYWSHPVQGFPAYRGTDTIASLP